jgi:hypothetical protein
VGEQVLPGPVIHRWLEQLFISDMLDRFSQALVCLTHGANQAQLVHLAIIGQTFHPTIVGRGSDTSHHPEIGLDAASLRDRMQRSGTEW